MNDSANIFISFASRDLKVAMTLCQALETRGFHCWISARDILPGENFQVSIVRALRRAKIMLLVFTANSNTSEEMTKELAIASQQKLIVIPLRVEDVAPNDAFAYEFATRQWIDFFADWEAAIEQLGRRISHALSERAAEAAAVEAAAGNPILSLAAQSAESARPAPPPAQAAPQAAAPKRPPEDKSFKAEKAKAEKPPLDPEASAKAAKRAGVLALAAAVIVVVAGLGLVGQVVMRNLAKPPAAAEPQAPPEPQTAMVAVATTTPVQITDPAVVPTAAPPIDPAAAPTEAAKPKARPKAKAAAPAPTQDVSNDIPF